MTVGARNVHDLVEEGSQFVVSTHSPVLLGYPGTRIHLHSEHYELTRSLLDDRERFLRHLFGGE